VLSCEPCIDIAESLIALVKEGLRLGDAGVVESLGREASDRSARLRRLNA
jgi:hypothetical protein